MHKLPNDFDEWEREEFYINALNLNKQNKEKQKQDKAEKIYFALLALFVVGCGLYNFFG